MLTITVIMMLKSEVLVLVLIMHAALLRDMHRAIGSFSTLAQDAIEVDRDTARRL